MNARSASEAKGRAWAPSVVLVLVRPFVLTASGAIAFTVLPGLGLGLLLLNIAIIPIVILARRHQRIEIVDEVICGPRPGLFDLGRGCLERQSLDANRSRRRRNGSVILRSRGGDSILLVASLSSTQKREILNALELTI